MECSTSPREGSRATERGRSRSGGGATEGVGEAAGQAVARQLESRQYIIMLPKLLTQYVVVLGGCELWVGYVKQQNRPDRIALLWKDYFMLKTEAMLRKGTAMHSSYSSENTCHQRQSSGLASKTVLGSLQLGSVVDWNDEYVRAAS